MKIRHFFGKNIDITIGWRVQQDNGHPPALYLQGADGGGLPGGQVGSSRDLLLNFLLNFNILNYSTTF